MDGKNITLAKKSRQIPERKTSEKAQTIPAASPKVER